MSILTIQKKVNLSDFEVVFDEVAQTFSIQCKNGANIPNAPVNVADIKIIDETDGDAEFTFTNVDDLRTKLIAIGYTPYTGGAIPTPQTLAEILANGGREVVISDEIDYVSVSDNKSQTLILTGDGSSDVNFNLVDSEFEVGDEIVFWNGVTDNVDVYDVRIDNTTGLINPSDTSSFTIPYLNECRLIKIQPANWLIKITPYVSSGGGGYTDATFGAFVNSLTAKNTPIDADIINYTDSADSNKQKKITWLNAWTNYIKAKADSVYTTASAVAAQISTALASYSTTSQMNTALDLKADKSEWVDYSSVSTINGWSVFTTKEIFIKAGYKESLVKIKIEGTSNSGTTNCTINFNADESKRAFTISRNAGTYGSGVVDTTSGSSVLNFYNTVAGGAYTASGVKLVDVTLIIKHT